MRWGRGAAPDPSTWELLRPLLSQADAVVLAGPTTDSQFLLESLRLSDRSTLGAMLANCGGVLIDHGWLRLFGGGAAHLPSLLDANLNASHSPVDHLVIGFDVAGGRFSINGTGNRAEPGEVCYFAPDTLEWLPLGFGHTTFLSWALSDNLALFYRDLRWPHWQDEIRDLAPDHALASYPPPFAAESNNLSKVSRTQVPYGELLDFIDSAAEQLKHVPDGNAFHLAPNA